MTKKTDFFITYHHGDEMAARWIAAVLKQAQFSTLSDSWDFLPGEAPINKIEYMFTVARDVMVLISGKFLQEDLVKSFCGGPGGSFLEKSPLVAEGIVFIVRIEACDIRQVLGAVEYLDLADIDAKEAEKRLLKAVGGAQADQKETVPLPGSTGSREDILAKRKLEMDQLLVSTIKHNYHMKLDLEQEVLKEVEVKNEKTGEMEKRKEWVWEPVALDTVLKDGQNYILVNPSGMGKTTFLTYVACALLDCYANYPFLPLFFTCIGLNNRTGTQGSLVLGEWENLCVLMDALDQARDVDDIVSSLQLPDKPLHYKKAKIILSSRQNTAYKVKEGFSKIRLKLPEAEEVRHYLGEENYKKLAGTIEASGELVKAPVLLEMLKIITERGQVVSTLFNRADLYTEFTKVLLDQERSKPRFWQDRLAIRHFIDYELEQALEKIAFFSLVDNGILEIPKEKLALYCESPEKKEALLSIGILLEFFEDRVQKIVFRHQSFQAYFAARYIYYQQPEIFRELVSDIAFFYNDVWYEVMRFIVGMEKDPQKAGKIIETIIKKGKSVNAIKKIIRWIKRMFKKYDLTEALRLIFAFYLMSEALVVSREFVLRVYTQLRDLLKKNKRYLYSFFSNSDKFNKTNEKNQGNLLIIFNPLFRIEDGKFRYLAINTLGKIGTAKDIPLLEPLFKDKNENVRCSAAHALGTIGTSEHIPLLEPLLRDKDEYVRSTAGYALGKIGTSIHIPLLKPLLRDKFEIVRSAAVESLGKIGASDHIPLLEPLIKDSDWKVRSAASEALGKIVTAKDIPLLEPLLRDKNEDVRCAAAEALGIIGKSDHIPLLEPLLRDESADVRRAAVRALGKIVTAKDIPILEPLLRDEDKYVRSVAAESLGKIGSVKDIPLLEPLIWNEDEYVRSAATEALGKIAEVKDISFIFELLLKDWWPYIIRYGLPNHIRRGIAGALGEIGVSKDIHLLKPLLRDGDKYLRRTAVKSLGKIGSVKDIPLLEPLLRDEFSDVRSVAVRALGEIGTNEHIPLLKPLLSSDEESIVQWAAIKSLIKIGTAKDISLIKLQVRNNRHFAEVLGEIGTAEHIPLLEPRFRNVFYVDAHLAAAGYIEKMYKRSTPKLRIDRVLPLKKEEKELPLKLFSGQALHILHISDIHYTLEKDSTITCIFHEFLEDIKKWRAQQNHTKIQTICLTGDIAASGQNEQYDAIHEKINTILETTGCPIENLFIIPGNHDVKEYEKISDQGKSLLEQAQENKINIDTAVLNSDEHYRLFHDKFTNYYHFIEKYGYHNSLPDNRLPIPNLLKPWYNRKLKDFPVRIMGLNSALFCLQGFIEYGKILMGTHQFQEAYFHGKGHGKGKADHRQDPEVVILLTHHPLNWLAESEYDDYSTLLERYAVLHLHGHIHKTHIEKKQRLFSSSGGYVSIGTGSLYGEKGKEDINTYHIITLDFENQELHVWARRWNPDTGRWTVYDDDGNNRFRLPVKR